MLVRLSLKQGLVPYPNFCVLECTLVDEQHIKIFLICNHSVGFNGSSVVRD